MLYVQIMLLCQIGGLHTYFVECFDSLDDRIDAIDARFEGMDTRITQLEEDVSYLRRGFDLPPLSSQIQSIIIFDFTSCIWLCFYDIIL